FSGREALMNFSTARLQSMALPMAEGLDLNQLRDAVVPDGLLDRVRVRLLGLPIEVNGYYDMIKTLEGVGYSHSSGDAEGGIPYDTCFTFGYDWRRDLSETAQELAQYIEEKKAYLQEQYELYYGVRDYDVKFDIVAHSMGGLITRYYLLYGDEGLPLDGSLPNVTWSGAENIRKAV
ncbi:MAG: hypothetical protein GY706_11060, partial [Bacteroides sp.]|nr:hypothetical protein [Bacteroides sp.]